nr:MAG TPA: hypothetical protein [Caudoviricetes sp.]
MLPIRFFSCVFVLFYIFFEIKRKPANIGVCGFFLDFLRLCKFAFYYRLENCGARRAFFKPYFFLSFIRESRVRNPAFLRIGLKSASASFNARAIP